MARVKRGPTSPEMNMTPLIDVTFQLIIFFLLVSNIVSKENVPMIVPRLTETQAREMGETERVVVNVAPEDFDQGDREVNEANAHLLHSGEAKEVKVSLETYDPTDVAGIKNHIQEATANNEKVEVVLRADSALYYKEIQRVMSAITSAGVSKINLVTHRKDE
jgi:biopolymer transport protein ExbD